MAHLLVEEDKNGPAAVHVGVLQDAEHLVARFFEATSIGGVYDKDERVSVSVVVPPERSQLLLPADVPVGAREEIERGEVKGHRGRGKLTSCGASASQVVEGIAGLRCNRAYCRSKLAAPNRVPQTRNSVSSAAAMAAVANDFGVGHISIRDDFATG